MEYPDGAAVLLRRAALNGNGLAHMPTHLFRKLVADDDALPVVEERLFLAVGQNDFREERQHGRERKRQHRHFLLRIAEIPLET